MTADQDIGSPIARAFCPLSAEQTIDPHPILARARMRQPVFFSEALQLWVVTRHEDVSQIYSQPQLFSSQAVLAPRMARPAAIDEEFGDRQLGFHHQLVMSDPPVHTRLKKLMSPAFFPRRVLEHAPFISGLAHRLIDELAVKGRADLVSDYAALIPPLVIGRIVGAPEGDGAKFSRWVRDIFTLSGASDVPENDLASAWRGVFAFEDYIAALIADRRRQPREDLTSDFIQARSDDGTPAMSDIEVLWNVFNVAGAGSDTTGVLIGNLLYLLLRDRDRWAAVCRDPALLPAAIEEAMRLRSPVRGLMRKVTQDTVLGGVAIGAGEMVFIHLASANHDEAVFAEPDRFDMTRTNLSRHLGFGSRHHACIGASLARLETRLAVEALMERLPELELAAGDEDLIHHPNLMMPSFTNLLARWPAGLAGR